MIDRRSADRPTGHELYLELVRAKNDLALMYADAERLRAENRALRTVVHDQARLRDRSDFKHTPCAAPVFPTPNGSGKGLAPGAAQIEEIQ
jgi:hypothetical protein